MCDWVPKGKMNAQKGEWNKIQNPNESAKPFGFTLLGCLNVREEFTWRSSSYWRVTEACQFMHHM